MLARLLLARVLLALLSGGQCAASPPVHTLSLAFTSPCAEPLCGVDVVVAGVCLLLRCGCGCCCGCLVVYSTYT